MPVESTPVKQDAKTLSKMEALRRVARGIDSVRYGEVVVRIQAGKVVWVDIISRERVG